MYSDICMELTHIYASVITLISYSLPINCSCLFKALRYETENKFFFYHLSNCKKLEVII